MQAVSAKVDAVKRFALEANSPVTAEAIGAPAFLVPPRCDQPELLDLGAGTPDDVRASLYEMWRLNHVFGGIHALTAHLLPLLQQAQQPLCVADIGTGAASIAHYLDRWAASHHLKLKILALDISGRNLDVARENNNAAARVRLVQADAEALPLAAGVVDYYISSLFLHHFAPAQVIQMLRAMYQRARRGIIMSDLVRGHLPMMAFGVIQPIFARNVLTRHDGRVSIRRAYRPRELLALAHAANIPNARVFMHFPWRMTLVAEKHHV